MKTEDACDLIRFRLVLLFILFYIISFSFYLVCGIVFFWGFCVIIVFIVILPPLCPLCLKIFCAPVRLVPFLIQILVIIFSLELASTYCHHPLNVCIHL